MAKRAIERRTVINILGGKIDSATSDAFGVALKEALDGIHTKRRFSLVVDLSDITYMNSAGFRELIIAQKNAGKRGGKIFLDMVPEQVKERLRITGFDEMLPQKTA